MQLPFLLLAADAEPAPPPAGGELKAAPAEGDQAQPAGDQGATKAGTQVAGGPKKGGPGKEPDSGIQYTLLMIGFFLVIIYFFMWRPQKKQKEERQQLMSGLKKNDKVVTIGGIHGTVHQVKVEEGKVVLRIDDKTNMTFSISAVSQINPKKAEVKQS